MLSGYSNWELAAKGSASNTQYEIRFTTTDNFLLIVGIFNRTAYQSSSDREIIGNAYNKFASSKFAPLIERAITKLNDSSTAEVGDIAASISRKDYSSDDTSMRIYKESGYYMNIDSGTGETYKNKTAFIIARI